MLMGLLALSPADGRPTSEEMAGLLTAGRAALEDGLPSVAQKQLRRYLELAEKNRVAPAESETAVVLLVRALHAEGKQEEILSFLQVKNGWIRKSEQQDAVHFWRAVALYELGRCDDAMQEIADLSERFPGTEYAGRAHRLRAWCLLKQGQADRAIEEFAAFDASHRDSPEYGQNLLDWGEALVAAAKCDEARLVLERLEGGDLDAGLARAGRLWLGRALDGSGEVDQAIESFCSVTGDEEAPAALRAEAFWEVAALEERRMRLPDAIVALQTGLELAAGTPAEREGRYNLGRLLLVEGRFDEAVPLLKAYIAVNPSLATARRAQLTLANALLKAGRNAEAVNEYQYYLESYAEPAGQAEASYGRGAALLEQGRLAEAAASFEKAFGLYTNSVLRSQSLFKMGDAYLANAQYGLAAQSYQNVLELFPDSDLVPGALFQHSESLARGGKLAEAEQGFQAVVDRYPDRALAEEALYRMARLKEDAEQWDASIPIYDHLMEIYSNGLFYAEALYGRGTSHFRRFQFDEALADFERIGAHFGDSAVAERAEFKRAMSLYWMGRDVEAVAVCRRFATDRPDSSLLPEVFYWLGKSNFNRGDFVAAEADFISFQSRFPTHRLADDSLLWAAAAAAHQKEYVRATELLAQLFKAYPESDKMAEGRFAQADAFCELANYSAAILIYDEIINKYPDSGLLGAAWGRKGDCQFTLGAEDSRRYQESIESYRVVANSPTAGGDEVLQAAYKIGRCLEKIERTDEALEQYYAKVVVSYLREGEKGVWHNETAKVWFTRAAFSAADIMESREDWRGAVRILERVVKAEVPAADGAEARIKKIRADHWWLFY